MYVIAINALSDMDMVRLFMRIYGKLLLIYNILQDYTLDFYLRQYWNDPRLAFDKSTGLDSITLGHEFGKAIWIPDVFFIQDRKESFHHTITTKNEFVKVDYQGNVTRSIR